ncbi:hypothetical protein ABEZ21_04035 [Brevibacillus porteri]|uniref:Uncharacterized protein n=1 Tax=Brevibacillus porteri TaxID=2126350 RepID=A0ABX5FG62_9BACL|nr:hypothetical protein [Brevibacillus porteri]MED1802085.1 hypothetical protein [Brevibacillus porteri]MED2133149.1 hypothetical protein [Brevibacillus porteri]MED2748684.1 hypothetical protein [Brevibacillus porteri]MED2813356.1 hypothetical protein [Brevibacillus porteri]MED4899543.1 hypothetical protein [Brevibacillus porteri]
MQIEGQEIPVYDDLADLTLEQLQAEMKRLGPIYVNRFEVNIEEYMAIRIYVAISMMVENIERGVNRWHRIDSGRERDASRT